MDPAPLERLMSELQVRPGHRVHGILIVRHGRLVFEEYFPGLTHPTFGEQPIVFDRETRHCLSSVTKSFAATMLGIAIVFMVMASQFESLKGPFVIMFAMPFAFSGMVVGCLIGGVTLNVISFMGLVMLMGIVVNNAIVLVDYVNLLRAQGNPLREALVEGARRRLRPVLMTATTTICTMIPLAVSTAEGSETWRPLGWAMVGGLSISTVVTDDMA